MSITIKVITASVAEAGGISKVKAEQLVVAVFDTISASLKAGEEVTVRNFGRLFPKVKPARAARNPRTGAAVQVAEKTVFKFAPRGHMKA
jgi:DNA-binding protein HU-beta